MRNRFPEEGDKTFEFDFDSWVRTNLMLRIANDGDAVSQNMAPYYSKSGKVKEVAFDCRFDVFDDGAAKHYEKDLANIGKVLHNVYAWGGFRNPENLSQEDFIKGLRPQVKKSSAPIPNFNNG